ncbi:MAG TPA: hypothetical protein VEM36_04060 [Xanthobacteraceae bacterium]|nr:hypothetical protein [Xanthobacteraceae bacterium]
MNLKLVIAVVALAALPAMPVAAQGQKGPPPAQKGAGPAQKGAPAAPPVPSKAEVQKVVQTISADQSKVATYCSIQKLGVQMNQAQQKKDQKKMQDLEKQADAMAAKLGPDYVKVMDGLETVDPESKDGKELVALLEPLDKMCK